MEEDHRARKPPKKDTVVKKLEVCADILRSTFFLSVYNVTAINPNKEPEVSAELKKKHPMTYEDVYEIKNSSEVIRFVNPYKLRDVVTAGSYVVGREYVFACLARRFQSDKIEVYFLSQEYELQEEGFRERVGRFVFTSLYEATITVIALAEEPAGTRGDGSSHSNHVESHETIYATQGIHELSEFHMNRLCVLAMSAEKYARKFIFFPGEGDNVDAVVDHIDMSTEDLTYSYYKNRWSVRCNVLEIDTDNELYLYLSRDGSGDFICSKSMREEIDSYITRIATRIGLNVNSDDGEVHKTA